jgi:hypothetical protein
VQVGNLHPPGHRVVPVADRARDDLVADLVELLGFEHQLGTQRVAVWAAGHGRTTKRLEQVLETAPNRRLRGSNLVRDTGIEPVDALEITVEP